MLEKLILNGNLMYGHTLSGVLASVKNSASVATLTDLELRLNHWCDFRPLANLGELLADAHNLTNLIVSN